MARAKYLAEEPRAWTDEEKRIAIQMKEDKCTFEEIGKRLDRSRHSVRSMFKRKDHLKPENPLHLPLKYIERDRIEAERKEAEKMAQVASDMFEPPVITCLYDDEQEKVLDQVSLAERWRLAEEEATRHIIKSQTENRFTATFSEDWVLICAMSDLHIAPGTPVDFKRMREDAELIRRTPRCYAMIGGDVVDNHIKIPQAVLAARSTPGDQWQLYEHWLGILGPRIACCIAGNHDEWTKQRAGVDMLGWIMGQRKVHYSKDEAWIRCNVGKQQYTFAMRHQYRMNSSFNQTHAVKQWLRNGEDEFDIGVIGHHHGAAIESFQWHGKQRWAARPGAYQITSAYTRQYGWNDSVPIVPTFLLKGDERRVIGFPDIRDAITALNSVL